MLIKMVEFYVFFLSKFFLHFISTGVGREEKREEEWDWNMNQVELELGSP